MGNQPTYRRRRRRNGDDSEDDDDEEEFIEHHHYSSIGYGWLIPVGNCVLSICTLVLVVITLLYLLLRGFTINSNIN